MKEKRKRLPENESYHKVEVIFKIDGVEMEPLEAKPSRNPSYADERVHHIYGHLFIKGVKAAPAQCNVAVYMEEEVVINADGVSRIDLE